MIVYKISLHVKGKSLIPEELIPKLSSELEAVESFKPSDTFTKKGKVKQYGFGFVSMMHPDRVYIDEYYDENYEEYYAEYCLGEYQNIILEFLKFNYKSIIENGSSEISILYEVYQTNDIISLDLFSSKECKIIRDCNAQVLFSVYKMTKKRIKEIFLS